MPHTSITWAPCRRGDRPHRRIEHAGAAAGELEHGGVFGIDAGAQNHVDVRLAQHNDGPLEFVGDGVDVDPGAHDVIAAAPQADHVRLQGEGRFELLGDDRPQQPAANGEVGVLQRLAGGGGQVPGEPIGPAARAAVRVGVD